MPKKRKIIKILPCFNRDQNEVETDVADFSNFLEQKTLAKNILKLFGTILYATFLTEQEMIKNSRIISVRSCVVVLPGNFEDNEWGRRWRLS